MQLPLPRFEWYEGRPATRAEILVAASALLYLWVLATSGTSCWSSAGKRSECLNRQRKLAAAMQNHDLLVRRLPGWAEPMVKEKDVRPTPVSWVWPLMQHLDLDGIYRSGVDPASPETFNVSPSKWPKDRRVLYRRELKCPGNPREVENWTRLDYVVNTGCRDGAPTYVGFHRGGNAGSVAGEDPRENAVFLNHYPRPGAVPPAQTLEFIAENDGTSDTILLSENLLAGDWDFGAPATAADAREGSVALCYAERRDSGPDDMLRINAVWSYGLKGGSWPFEFWRPEVDPFLTRSFVGGQAPGASSAHEGGVVVCFCDGHVSFVHESIDWKVWTLLFTPQGAKAVVPGTKWPSVFADELLRERF